MVKDSLSPASGQAAERALAIGYAPADRRAALSALLALDSTLAAILRSTREPLVGQMRLVWWRDALEALDTRPPPAEPVLTAVAREVLGRGVKSPIVKAPGVTGGQLAMTVEGWEFLLAEPLDEEALRLHATGRGGALFAAAATVLGADVGWNSDPWGAAGEGWALADVARNLSRPALAAWAAEEARNRLAAAFLPRWPAQLRSLGALALSAQMDLAPQPRPAEHPVRVWRLLRFRLTGR